MKLVNLSPHPVHIMLDGERVLTIPADPNPTRLDEEKDTFLVEPITHIQGGRNGEVREVEVEVEGRISTKEFFPAQELPDPEPNCWFITSSIVAGQSDRDDLIVPNTVRDENGQITGCLDFSVIK